MNNSPIFYIFGAIIGFIIAWIIQHHIIKGAVKSALKSYDDDKNKEIESFAEKLNHSDLIIALGGKPDLFDSVNESAISEYKKERAKIINTEFVIAEREKKLKQLELNLYEKSNEAKKHQ